MKETSTLVDNAIIKQPQWEIFFNIKVLCMKEQCGHQFSSKVNLSEHKKAVHEGIKYPCGKCTYQASDNGYLTQDRRAVQEGLKYP